LEAWPVCSLILRDDTPACAALVANPARRLWPEKLAGSMSAREQNRDQDMERISGDPLY
jgi:hypothetical protein